MVFMDSPYHVLGVQMSDLDNFGRLMASLVYALAYFQGLLSFAYLDTLRRLSLLSLLIMLDYASSSLHIWMTLFTLLFCML